MIVPETEQRFEGGGSAYRVTSTDGSGRGAIFHLDDEVLEEHGAEAAARRLLGVVERVIRGGLPEKRAGQYVSYDAD
ncbi:hypothetical protein [Deinococcus sp.]|uniref:hypothetical protein n=1 Tax=Deinococcus sp. TaxID=47478 RepID=UPI003C7AB204